MSISLDKGLLLTLITALLEMSLFPSLCLAPLLWISNASKQVQLLFHLNLGNMKTLKPWNSEIKTQKYFPKFSFFQTSNFWNGNNFFDVVRRKNSDLSSTSVYCHHHWWSSLELVTFHRTNRHWHCQQPKNCPKAPNFHYFPNNQKITFFEQ